MNPEKPHFDFNHESIPQEQKELLKPKRDRDVNKLPEVFPGVF